MPNIFIPPLRPEPDLPALQLQNVQLCKITDEELQAFLQNPLDLLGRQFMLKGNEEENGLVYEVVKITASKEQGHIYGVQLADCVSAIEMDSDEMKGHLQESYLCNAADA